MIEEGVSGFLVPPHNTEGFVETLKRLFSPEFREQMGINARRHIQENFSMENNNEKRLELYRKLW